MATVRADIWCSGSARGWTSRLRRDCPAVRVTLLSRTRCWRISGGIWHGLGEFTKLLSSCLPTDRCSSFPARSGTPRRCLHGRRKFKVRTCASPLPLPAARSVGLEATGVLTIRSFRQALGRRGTRLRRASRARRASRRLGMRVGVCEGMYMLLPRLRCLFWQRDGGFLCVPCWQAPKCVA